ncbi:hypothetical protein EC2846750_4047 [Escherichia coli 2846750]|nr:hypothetical protein EC2846750_4047 [Escherichia coli 2846750]ESS93605.1 hypothetical protein L343_2785 [Escherichia coli CE549]
MRCNLDSAYGACDQHSPFFSVIPKMQNKQSQPNEYKEKYDFSPS